MSPRWRHTALAAAAIGMACAAVLVGLARDWWTAAAVGYACLFLLPEIARMLGLAEDDPHADCEPDCTADHCC